MMTRRVLLSATAGVALLTLPACSLTTSQIQADVEAIATGLSGLLTALAPLGVPADVLAKVQALLNTITSNAALIASGLSPNASVLTTISNAISALSVLVGPFFPMAPAIGAAIQAALVLINVVLTAAGAATPAPVTKAMATFKSTMTPDEARRILRGYAANGIK